jgi:DNA-binding LytR/AlgR family response regulator
MTTALIVEDELPMAAQLQEDLNAAWPELALLAPAHDGDTGLHRALDLKPDVVFLDIRMPGKTGLEVARELSDNGFAGHIVFVTAYDQHALEAFDAGGVDYLLKPLERSRLERTVQRLKQRLAGASPELTQDISPVLRRLLDVQSKPAGTRLQWIKAKSGASVRFIPVDEVLYFKADSKVMLVRTAEREAVISLTLKELLQQLDPNDFWQIHRSTIVRVSAIEQVKRVDVEDLEVHIKATGDVLPVSKPYFHLFKGM